MLHLVTQIISYINIIHVVCSNTQTGIQSPWGYVLISDPLAPDARAQSTYVVPYFQGDIDISIEEEAKSEIITSVILIKQNL